MKLLFNEQVIEFEKIPLVEEVLEKINDLLQNDFYFSHFIVDGKEVLEAPGEFLKMNLRAIESLEIISVSAKEFINNLLLSAEEYTKRAVPHITTLADEFYNNPSSSSWAELNELFEGIQWLSTMIETVDQSVVRPSNWMDVLTPTLAMQAELGNFEEALDNTDTVLIADMLHFEILTVFEALSAEMKIAIDTEGTRHDLN
ncbi:hypothetical protein MKZ26_19500 [Sporosarcina sp. FSL K6-6792]|uniref:hypothetical protein n=1 Tax=Sporosarcina sp. FSL K6-6792 TaxID=2921559 RepID=UPI0030FCE40C